MKYMMEIKEKIIGSSWLSFLIVGDFPRLLDFGRGYRGMPRISLVRVHTQQLQQLSQHSNGMEVDTGGMQVLLFLYRYSLSLFSQG